MSRLRKLAEEEGNFFNDIPRRKVAYSFKDVLGDVFNGPELLEHYDLNKLEEIINLDKIEREQKYIDMFIEMGGAEVLFNHMKNFYDLKDTFNPDIKEDIEFIVKHYYNYASTEFCKIGDSEVKYAIHYGEEEEYNNSSNEEEE